MARSCEHFGRFWNVFGGFEHDVIADVVRNLLQILTSQRLTGSHQFSHNKLDEPKLDGSGVNDAFEKNCQNILGVGRTAAVVAAAAAKNAL